MDAIVCDGMNEFYHFCNMRNICILNTLRGWDEWLIQLMEPGPAGDAGLDILDDGGDVDLDDVMEAAAIRVYLVTA